MTAKIQLFGSFKVVIDDCPVAFPTRPTESLCAYLAWRGRSMSRVEVAEVVWPDVEPEKSTNRLRTALVHLRKTLPIVADRTNVSLSLTTDLAEAEKLYRRSRIAQNVDEERETLQKLLSIIGSDFLADWREPWTEEPRLYWRERRIEVALRLASIGIGLEEYELAEGESLRALSIDDFNEEAWATYLRAMLELGRQASAVERFGVTRRKRLSELGFDFSKDLLQLAKRVSTGAPKPERSRFGAEARDLLSNTLERSDPELLLPILISDAFKKEALRKPFESWKLLHDVIEQTEGVSEARLQAMRLSILLAGMVDQYGIACDYAEWILDNVPETSIQHRHTLNMLGFMNFEVRDWDDAWRHLTRYQELAERYGSPGEVSIAKSQIAALYWHQGDLDRALEEYRIQAEHLARDESIGGLYNFCSLRGNTGTVLTIKGRWAEAREVLSESYSMSVSNGFDYLRSCITAQLGVAMIMTGDKAMGRKMAATGLAHTYRSRYRRMHQISADYAAAALAASGYARQGLAVLDAYTDFRAEAHHARSVAEDRFADWIRSEFGGSAQSAKADGRPSQIVADSCDILESS